MPDGTLVTFPGDGVVVDPVLPDPPCDQVDVPEISPEAARFAPGEPVRLEAELVNRSSATCTTTLRLRITDLGVTVHEETRRVALAPQLRSTIAFVWDAPDEDFIGYLAVLGVDGSDDEPSTGIDVSSTPLRFPRYGYISEFPLAQSREQSFAMIETLAEDFHLNLFQFYDWMYRHEDLVPRENDGTITPTWVDLFGRTNAWSTITDLVDATHAENAYAMAYVTIYTAREDYEALSGISPDLGLYETPSAETQVSLGFGGERRLFLFDPSLPEWQRIMADQYVDAVQAADFDGVHIDQFGPRPTYFRADGTPIDLNRTFAPFLEAVDEQLSLRAPESDACVFNLVDGSVGGYAVEDVARTTACDILYSEIWFITDTYEELRAFVELLREIGGERAVVLALYPQYGEEVGRYIEAEYANELDGVAIDDDHSGFSEIGFVDEFDAVGDSITWRFDMQEDGFVTFVPRYANATGAPATRTLVVDGEVLGKLTFPSRASWDEWAFDAWIQRRIQAGEHEVELVFAEDDVGVVNIDRIRFGEFDEDSVRLQNAVVFASGATPIQLGDEVQSLSHEYFPNRSRSLTGSFRRALRRQYSFITAHERLLFSPAIEPIPERLEKVEAISEGHDLIAEGTGGIWTNLKRTPWGDAIHLVNLVGVDDVLWRNTAPTPTFLDAITLRYDVADASAVTQVLWATPDEGPGSFQPLDFTRGDGFVEFTVPRLAYWDLVLVRFADTP